MQTLILYRSRQIVWLLHILGAALIAASCSPQSPDSKLRLGTTTSVENSGLLEFLLDDFQDQYKVSVDVIAVGTGQALAFGERGDVDIVLVHAPALEMDFVAAGYGTRRYAVMFNDFIILGPLDDPAGVMEAFTGSQALTKIANSASSFASRGDTSGTHIREMELWDQAGYSPSLDENWYYSLGQGMGATLNFANEFHAYVLTDRGTYLSQLNVLPNLTIVFGGGSIQENADAGMLNYYSVIPVDPALNPEINFVLAEKFIAWLTDVSTQEKIFAYGIDQFGQSLFYPNSDAWSQLENSVEDNATFQGDTDGQLRLENSGILESMLAIFQEDQNFTEIIFRTLQVSGIALLLACLGGIPLGVYLGLENFRGKRIMELIIYTGMGLPPVVVGLVVFLLLSNGGPLGWLQWLFTLKGMVLAQSILAFPLAAGLTASSVKSVPQDLILQVRSLGATRWQERWTVLRQARMGVIAAILAALGRIISEVGAVMLVGGNIAGNTRVLSTAIILETRQGAFGLALALGLVLLGVALLSNAFVLRFGSRWR